MRFTVLLCTLALMGLLPALAAVDLDSARLTVTLAKAQADADVAFSFVTSGTRLSRGSITGQAGTVDLKGLTLKDGKLTGEVKLQLTGGEQPVDLMFSLDATVKDDAITGSFSPDKPKAGTLTGAVAPSPFPYVGYRGDGTSVYPDSKPPTAWGEEKNLLWKTWLPNMGAGAPIVVKDRAFVVAEPGWKSDWPILVCIDTKDGKILWQKELDHIALMNLPKDQEATARKAWSGLFETERALFKGSAIWNTAKDKDAAKLELDAVGLEPFAKDGGFRGVHFKGDTKDRHLELARIYNRFGLYFEVWHWGRPGWVGYAYPTPVSDGERVYVATGLHGFFAFDLEGKALWAKFMKGQGSSNAGYGGDDQCKNARSPLLYGDLFISDVGNNVRAFDRKTGELKWAQPHYGKAHEIVSPAILTVAGQDVLMTASGYCHALPDGKEIACNWRNTGMGIVVNTDQPDVAYFNGGGEHGGWENKGNPPNPKPDTFVVPPAGLRFALKDGKLEHTVLWQGIDGKGIARNAPHLLYHQGKVYYEAGVVLDALTGKTLAGALARSAADPKRAVPATEHMLAIAGTTLYGMGRNNDKGFGYAFDLATGKPIATSTLISPAPVDDQMKDQRLSMVGGTAWTFSYGCPFTFSGDRMYIRSNDYLYCVGEK